MSGRPANTPDRALIVRIARAQAEAFGVSFDDVVGFENTPSVVDARHAAMRQIVEETSCSLLGLSWAWGCGIKEARRAFADLLAAPLPPAEPRHTEAPSLKEGLAALDQYDAGTMRRLAQVHPPHRVSAIVLGRDPETNNDIAAWRRLGSGSAAPRSTPVEI